MFYTHDLLTNSQHGVATIWLVATVGTRNGTKRITRKAIQDVDVQKAVDKIIHPGAPLALRLQGRLLYGVSQVYFQQCGYVLSDAEKVQTDMKLYFRHTHDQTIPEAGKAKRHQIIIEDDPSFDPHSQLPQFEFIDIENLLSQSLSSRSKEYSWLTPAEPASLSSSDHLSIPGFDLSQSDQSFARRRSASHSKQQSPVGLGQEQIGPLMDDLAPLDGFQLDFGPDGELVGILDPAPQLPATTTLPSVGTKVDEYPGAGDEALESVPIVDGDIILIGDEALPDAPPLPTERTTRLGNPDLDLDEGVADEVIAPIQRGRARLNKSVAVIDSQTQLTRSMLRSWAENYAENALAEKDKRRRTKRTATAQRNAYNCTYGFGIGNVGHITAVPGIQLPLANQFSGEGLLGRLNLEIRIPVGPLQRRRSSAEAFADDEPGDDRRVRARISEQDEQEFGRQIDPAEAAMMSQGDDMLPELGRDLEAPMDDHRSSSLMPWNRGSSAAPSSAVRSQRGAGPHHVPASPLVRDGSIIQDIERFTYDAAEGIIHSDNFSMVAADDFSVDELGLLDQKDSQTAQHSIDTGSGDFMAYLVGMVREKGVEREGDARPSRRWIDFEELAIPGEHSKVIASQAFYHILSMRTNNLIQVEQEATETAPFERIFIGVDIGDDNNDTRGEEQG